MTDRFDPSAPLSPAAAQAMARLLPTGMKPPNLFAGFARSDSLFAWMVDKGVIGPSGLLDRRAIPKEVRECTILRTCVATRNEYEFNLHVQTISARMGLTPAQIDDVRHARPDPGLWSPPQRAAMRLVDAVVAREVPDDVWRECRDALGESMVIELTQLAGMYVGVAMLVALLRPRPDAYRSAEPRAAA